MCLGGMTMFFYYNNNYSGSITEDAAKFLIQLYASTKYHCDCQKLQVLIILAQLALLADGQDNLLGTEPIIATTVGLGVESVSSQFGIVNFNVQEEKCRIHDVRKIGNGAFSQAYQYDTTVLRGIHRDNLRAIFEIFGAYPSKLLTEMTKYMQIYPNGVNFLRMPRYAVNVPFEDIDEYIYVLKRNTSADIQGITLIQQEVQRCMNKCISGDKMYKWR